MNTIQRIARNTAFLYAAYIVSAVLSLLIAILIARKLGDVTFGRYSFALAFTAIFAVFSELGYNTLLIREVARDKTQSSKYLNNTLTMRALLSLVVFTLIAITINIMQYPADVKNVVYLFGIWTLMASLSAVFKVTFRAFEKMEYEMVTVIIREVVRVGLGIAVLLLGYGLRELAFVFVFTGILDILLSFFICSRRFTKPGIEIDTHFWKQSIKVAIPLALLSIFGIIYVRIDMVMLSVMKGDAVVGWYNAAYNLVRGFRPIPSLFLNAIFPLMAGYFVSSIDSLKVAYEKASKFLLIIGLPLAVGITLLADRIILLLYGQQFYPAIIALQILAWELLLMFLYGPLGNVLVSTNRQNQMAIVAGLSALLNVILNLILIPPLSYKGAAIATIITETFLFGVYLYLVSKHLHTFFLHKLIIKPLIASLVMGLFIYFFTTMNLFLVIVLSIILYFAVLYLIRGFSKEDIALFRQVFEMPKSRRQ